MLTLVQEVRDRESRRYHRTGYNEQKINTYSTQMHFAGEKTKYREPLKNRKLPGTAQ